MNWVYIIMFVKLCLQCFYANSKDIQNLRNLLYRGNNTLENQKLRLHERVPRHLVLSVTEDTLSRVLNLIKQKHPTLNKRGKTSKFNDATMSKLKNKLKRYFQREKTRKLNKKRNIGKYVNKDILM